MTSPYVQLRRVSKRYGAVQALKEVDLDVYPGEILALVGDNGAGKSTLIKTISGVLRPTSGEVLIGGKRMEYGDPMWARRHGVETIYQDLALAENLNVAENMFLGRESVRRLGPIRLVNSKNMEREAVRFLDEIGIHIGSVRTRVENLSGGQRQSVAICRAMYWQAKVVIMDEPTAALAVKETRRVHDLARTMRDRQVGVIFIDHNLEHVMELADRVVVLRRGEAVATKRASETTKEEIVHYMMGA